MTEIQCPRCGREALGGRSVWSAKKPYCSACGWNVDRANSLAGKNQKLLAVFFVAIVVFFVGLAFTPGGASQKHPGSVIALALILAVMAAMSWHRSKSQKSAQTPAATIVPPPSASASAEAAAASCERLRMIRRPRPLRLKTVMRIFASVYVIILGSVAYTIFLVARSGAVKPDSKSLPNVLPFAIFLLIWSIVAFTLFRSIVRDRSLLSDGEIAVATVTLQSYAGGESRESRIVYTFKDAAGRTFSGKCTDRTRKVFEEMQTPIFYDPANPAKNVALVGATYNIVES